MNKSTMAGIGAAAVLAMAGFAAGCGGSSDSASGTSTEATTTTTTPTTQGGTARSALQSDADLSDTALAYYSVSCNIEYPTCASFVNYPDTVGVAGGELQPEVAEAMQILSNGAKT